MGVGVFKAFPVEKVILLASNATANKTLVIVGLFLFLLSISAFFISLIFTVLVLKVWRFERLTDPEQTAIKAIFVESEQELISYIISDYVVACNRNHKVIEKKAKYLSHGLRFLLLGLVLFVTSLFIVNGLIAINGGTS